MATPKGVQVAQWLRWADEDYLAARALLRRSFVLQGAVLATTAIEKFVKAALVVRGATFRNTHNVVALYEALKETGTVAPVNIAFLQLLGKAYKLRYPDDLPAGFNVVLVDVKILAEMDATVQALRSGFKFRKTNGGTITTRLDALLARKEPELLERNAAFGSCSRADVFAQPIHVYEIRVLDVGNILEVQYEAAPTTDDGILDQEGLKPGLAKTPPRAI